MENMTKCFSLNYKHILLDEIALDGLQGIGVESLWKRVEHSIGTPLTAKIKEKYWKFIVEAEAISVYNVPESPPLVDIKDRFAIIDEATGYILDSPDYLDGPYEWCPVDNEHGSCSNYDTRILLTKMDIKSMTYEAVKSRYGDKIVLVASLEERWHALVPHLHVLNLKYLTTIQYGLLELIGKGRGNGQMSVGTTNLSKIVNEPKLLFYNRNVLQKLDMIEAHYATQMTFGKAMKSILLRLKRFRQPTLENLPKAGIIANLVNYLLKQPDHSEITEVLCKKGLMTSKDSKRFQKTANVFSFDEREVKVEKKSAKGEKHYEMVKKKFILLTPKSDESSSEEENENTPLQCQYKVGVSLMRQAYERILDAGLKGLTQIEIAQLIGVEFYTSRTICRIFKQKNLVREFLEDKGRQRTARYIAVAATKEIDKEYAKEKKMLLEHVKSAEKSSEHHNKEKSDSECDIPIKKLKLEEDSKVTKYEEESTYKNITEVKQIEGFENVKDSLINAKKNLTLRQLKFANGILKVVKEQNYVLGFQTLSILVSKKINEPPMDTKCLKKFIHKLMADNQLKVLKITTPHKLYCLICAPNIKPTDEVIKKIYKKLTKTKENNKNKIRKTNKPDTKWQFLYQRYLKIQKLHEFVTKFVYFSDVKPETTHSFAPGFTSLLTIIPEMSVEFALSYINNVNTSDLAKAKTEDFKEFKVREAPDKLKTMLLQSQSLQNCVKIILKILAALGLIQLIHQPQTSTKTAANTLVFYVNRRAKVLDTSGVWPRPVDQGVLEKSFYFETFEDVKTYWDDVTTISSNTTIKASKRDLVKLVHPRRSETDVEAFDDGRRLGDGLGPCGFDSSIFVDIPRLWRKFVTKPYKIPQSVPIKRKPRRRVVKRSIKVNKANDETAEGTMDKKKKRAETAVVKCSKFEDKILMLCSAAMTVLSPTSQPGSLRIRNIVARDLVSMIDPKKTAAYCHKRIMVMESNSILTYERDCIVSELRRRRKLVKKYDGLLKVLRQRYITSTARYVREARLPLLELIWLASQIEKDKLYIQRIPCIAFNFEDFNRNYTIATTTSNRPYNLYRTPTTCEPEFATLKEGIMLSVMLSVNNPVTKDTAQKIFKIFEVYPENMLRSAVEQLRSGGAITTREKGMNPTIQRDFDDIVESSYRISVAYRRRFITRFETEFLVNLANIFTSGVPDKGLKGSGELNCFLCELNACDVLEIKSDNIPMITGSAGSLIQEEQMNVIDMETKYKLKSGTVGWKTNSNIDDFSELYKGIEYASVIDAISKNNVLMLSDCDVVYDVNNPIILYLERKGEKGCTFHELLVSLYGIPFEQNQLSMDRNTLCARLKELEAKKLVKRVGYYENLIALTKYAMALMLQVGPNFYIIPTPWLTLEGQIQNEIFIKWTSVVVNKVFESPGCSIEFLSSNFECISTRSVQDICTFLQGCECVTLRCVEKRPIDLFSEHDDDVPDLYDYNPYDSPDNILVFPVKNMLTKYTCIWKTILKEIDT